MGLVETLGSYITEYFFMFLFGVIPNTMNLISDGLWRAFVKPMFRPETAAPNILNPNSANRYAAALHRSVELNEFFLEFIVTPIILLGILIIGVMYLFGNVLDMRKKLKDAMPKFILATILAYTTQIWMDVLMTLCRGLMGTIYNDIPGYLMMGTLSDEVAHASAEMGLSGPIAGGFLVFLIAFIALFLMLGIMLSLSVRIGVVYAGIAIMPITTITLGIPYVDKVGKKFIKIWIQLIFFIFWMAIPTLFLEYVHGLARLGFLILIMGMPFLLVTGEVLALRGAGMVSGGQMAQKGVMMAKGAAMMGAKAVAAPATGGASAAAGSGASGAASGAAGGSMATNLTSQGMSSMSSSGPASGATSSTSQATQGTTTSAPRAHLDQSQAQGIGPPTSVSQGYERSIGSRGDKEITIDETPETARIDSGDSSGPSSGGDYSSALGNEMKEE